ncbi:MAG: hypothetical protein WBB51_05555, partial [Candidatus Microthrix parvicella]
TPKNRRDFVPIGRRNFIELCVQLTGEDELVFEELWRRLGLSVATGQTGRHEQLSRQRRRVTAG